MRSYQVICGIITRQEKAQKSWERLQMKSRAVATPEEPASQCLPGTSSTVYLWSLLLDPSLHSRIVLDYNSPFSILKIQLGVSNWQHDHVLAVKKWAEGMATPLASARKSRTLHPSQMHAGEPFHWKMVCILGREAWVWALRQNGHNAGQGSKTRQLNKDFKMEHKDPQLYAAGKQSFISSQNMNNLGWK